MTFCSNCGNQMADDAKYCAHCGSRTLYENESRDKQENYFTRSNEYAGNLIKCPACGTELPSLTAICPACGHEVNSVKVSDSLQSFIAKIDDCDRKIAKSGGVPKKGWSSWGKWKKIGWVILNVYLICIPLLIYFLLSLVRIEKTPSLTAEERQKVTIIENYTFPNDRGSILEAMLFIGTKVDFLAEEKANTNNLYWIKLWSKKAGQLHQKAELLFPGDTIANDTYTKIMANFKKAKQKMHIRIGVTVAVIVVVILYLVVKGNNGSTDNNEMYDWPVNQFTEILPEPIIKTGKIAAEYEQQFQFELYNVSQVEFEDYVKDCRNVGFTFEITKTDSVFYADNAEGYNLNIFYYDDDEEMHVSIDCYGVNSEDNSSHNDNNVVQSLPNNLNDSGN